MNDYLYYVPKLLDQPPKVFLWDFDVALVFSLFFVVALAVNQPMIGICLALGSSYYLNKAKRGKGQGFALSLAYWWLPSRMGFKRVPPSAMRNFLG